MAAPSYSVTDYFTQFQRLLPRGRVWHRGWGSVQAEDLLTLMPTWARLHARANDVLVETFPCTVAAEMLPEWEATLGLPDCEALGTIQQRQAAVCAKFALRGGQSIPFYIELLAAHGFAPVTIHEFVDAVATQTLFSVDTNRAEDPLASAGTEASSIFTWAVTVPSTPVVYFTVDHSTVEEPLASWGSDQLVCLLDLYKPAHTTVLVRYA